MSGKKRQGNGEAAASPRLIAAREKEREALELKKSGLTYEWIASQLGYSTPSAAWKAVRRALARIPAAAVDELRQLEGERLDAMLAGLWSDVLGGTPRAVEVAVAVSKRRADLFGLDAPVKNELTGKDGGPLAYDISFSDESLQALAALARAELGTE